MTMGDERRAEVQRNVDHYQGTHEHRGQRSGLWQLVQRFDHAEGDYTYDLIQRYNAALAEDPATQEWVVAFDTDPTSNEKDSPTPAARPRQILFIDASNDQLPTGLEAAAIIRHSIARRGWDDTTVRRVDTYEQLRMAVDEHPCTNLILSMCVDKQTYNTSVAAALEAAGEVCVPGVITAPGAVFSDKLATYRLLEALPPGASRFHGAAAQCTAGAAGTADATLIARYRFIDVDDLDAREKAAAIVDCVDTMAEEEALTAFFIKPREGGGGLGGFRLSHLEGGYLLPDLSKLTGNDREQLHPAYITFDPENEAQLEELAWIFRRFERDPAMAETYLHVTLDELQAEYGVDSDIDALYEHITRSNRTLELERSKQHLTRTDALMRLANAIRTFETKRGVPYEPLVCEHIDFGTWGLRVHLRLGRAGPVVESVYYRIFQLLIDRTGIGYIGADNISNKLTGALETLRCGPPLPLMIDAIGGEAQLRRCFHNAVTAFIALIEQLSPVHRSKVPVRAQFDISPVNGIIVEGNADTARGPGLGTRWEFFVQMCEEWLEDSLAYYAYRQLARGNVSGF